MIGQAAVALACGLATVGVSEAVLRLLPGLPGSRVLGALFVGTALRTLWVLALLAWALSAGLVDPLVFLPFLMLGYLVAQVWGGVRYTRYFDRC